MAEALAVVGMISSIIQVTDVAAKVISASRQQKSTSMRQIRLYVERARLVEWARVAEVLSLEQRISQDDAEAVLTILVKVRAELDKANQLLYRYGIEDLSESGEKPSTAFSRLRWAI
ncbi:hypothetical protein MMC12_008513 [Toensbergia leucococca]|nr:hypothetical protein [Toensbergia leucococca]